MHQANARNKPCEFTPLALILKLMPQHLRSPLVHNVSGAKQPPTNLFIVWNTSEACNNFEPKRLYLLLQMATLNQCSRLNWWNPNSYLNFAASSAGKCNCIMAEYCQTNGKLVRSLINYMLSWIVKWLNSSSVKLMFRRNLFQQMTKHSKINFQQHSATFRTNCVAHLQANQDSGCNIEQTWFTLLP